MKKILLLSLSLLFVICGYSQRSVPRGGTSGQTIKIGTDGYSLKWEDVGSSSSGDAPLYFVDVATTASLAVTYSSGTLTATSNGRIANIDGINVDTNSRILNKNAVAQLQNGIYVVYDTGTVSTPYILVRDTTYDETDEVYPSQINVLSGSVNANKYFLQQTVNPVIGTSAIVYTSIAAPTFENSEAGANFVSYSNATWRTDTALFDLYLKSSYTNYGKSVVNEVSGSSSVPHGKIHKFDYQGFAEWVTKDFIPVNPSLTYYGKIWIAETRSPGYTGAGVLCYDKDYNLLSTGDPFPWAIFTGGAAVTPTSTGSWYYGKIQGSPNTGTAGKFHPNTRYVKIFIYENHGGSRNQLYVGGLEFSDRPIEQYDGTYELATQGTNRIAINSSGNLSISAVTAFTNSITSLGSFTSTILATALTDETGTGAAVFASAPTLTNPVVGTQSPGDNSTKAASTAYADAAAAAAGAISQTQKIYVDAQAGTDDGVANRGNINKQYKTIEYVVANVNNTGTITAVTTSGSATLTGVSSTASIILGQYLGGTGIPYSAVVTAFTSSTIVMSLAATASGTITTTYVTPYTIECTGSFNVTSNIYKDGFFYNFGNSTVSFGNMTLFDRGANVRYAPEIIRGGSFYGTHANSKFKSHGAANGIGDVIIDIKSYSSIGTSYAIDGNNSFDIGRIVYINCPNWDARFGYIGKITNCTNLVWGGYKYGLLGGVELRIGSSGSYVINGITETPSSIRAIDELVASKAGSINGIVYGSANVGFGSSNITINANMPTGSTFISSARSLTFNGDLVTSTGTVSGNNVNFNGFTYGNFTVSSAFSKFADATGSYTLSGGIHYIEGGIGNTGGTQYLENIVLSSNAQVFLNANDVNLSTTTPGNVSVASGCTLENRGKIACIITSLAGTLINKGDLNILYKTPAITGILENRGGYISLYRYGQAESSTYTPTIDISTGSFIMDGGSLVCAVADSKSGLIRKTASGGKVVLMGQPYLKVANGLAPLQILSNTGTTQDVFDFSLIDNCAVGFRLADTFTDVTYGTAYAPNLLIGGVKYEATTNTW